MSRDTLPIRASVTAFAAISFALKAALILLLVVPAVIPVQRPGPTVLLALLAAVLAATFVSGLLVRRLSETELAVVQFWSLTPLLILLVFGMLSALPMLFFDQLASWLRWSEASLRYLAAFTLTGSLISAGIVIWAFWRQFRASLPSRPACPGSRPDDPAGSSA